MGVARQGVARQGVAWQARRGVAGKAWLGTAGPGKARKAGKDIQMKPLLRETQVAEILAVSLSTVRAWRAKGNGPPFIKLGRAVRYRPEHLASWIDEQQQHGSTSEMKR